MNLNYLCFSRRNLKIKTLIGEKNFKNIENLISLSICYENKNENFLNQELFKRTKNVDLILVGRLKTVNLKDLNNFMLRNKNANCYIDAINDQHQNYFNMLKKKNIFKSTYWRLFQRILG